jgi:hypothetical protein
MLLAVATASTSIVLHASFMALTRCASFLWQRLGACPRILVGIIFVAVIGVGRYLDSVIPSRLTEHRSTTVRAVTRRTYGLYLVGFYTLIAMLVLFQAVDHLI